LRFVWEPVWESSTAIPSVPWGTGGFDNWGGGGFDNWGNGGSSEWSGSGTSLASNKSSAGKVGVKSEGDRQRVVQVVEGHVGEGISEEVGIDFAVGNSACVFFSVSVLTVVGGAAQ